MPSRTSGGARRYSATELLNLKKEIRPFAGRKKGLLSISQAAKALQVSADTLRDWDKKGLIETGRSKGGARRFTRDEIKRLQAELGIKEEAKHSLFTPGAAQLLLPAPKINHEITKFTFPWSKVAFSTILIIVMSAASWFFAAYIDPLERKVNETSKLLGETVKSIEVLQRGVLGIQIQPSPSPANPSSSPVADSANYNNGVVLVSAKAPLVLDTSSSQIQCISCLTQDSPYIQAMINSDGALSITLDNKVSTVSLNLTHSNSWPSFQSFKGGIGIGTDSAVQLFQLNTSTANPVVMTAAGNVGIGITSPVNKLEVAGAQTIGVDYAGVYTAPTNGLLVQGNVGIGISAPSYHLDVAGGARFGCTGNTWNDGPVTNCSDVAEVYQSDGSVGVGEIVALARQVNVVTKSKTAYQQGMIGVYSASPALLVGGQTVLGGAGNLTDNKIPVALAGRVPVKVSDENGPIQAGDYLTSSSIPGVAMKATKPGPVIGQALEGLDFNTGAPIASQGIHLIDIKRKFGTVLAFINVSYADPGNFLQGLSMDDQGTLIVPRIKTSAVALDPLVAVPTSLDTDAMGQLALNTDPDYTSAPLSAGASAGPSLAFSTNKFIDLSGEIASIEDRIQQQESRIKALEARVNIGNVGIGITSASTAISQYSPSESASRSATSSASLEATSSASLSVIPSVSEESLANASSSTELRDSSLASPDQNDTTTKLTPPDILLATASASLTSQPMAETLSSDKLFSESDIKISGNLNVFGKTTLANTMVAGDLTVDGTLALNGNSLNVIGAPDCSEENKTCGILYIQNSPLAYQVDFFNGLASIDKFGNFKAQTVTVAAFKVVANKISGSGKIATGTKSVDIENAQVHPNSRILITPNSETNLVLAVTDKSEGKKFTVSAAQTVPSDVIFDWFLINETSE